MFDSQMLAIEPQSHVEVVVPLLCCEAIGERREKSATTP